MKKLLRSFVNQKKDEISTVTDTMEILKEPGDNLSARITNSNRKVIKVETDNGNSKYNATQYPNGTVVETKTTKRK